MNFLKQETAFDVAASAERISICEFLIQAFQSQKNAAIEQGKQPPKILARTTGIEVIYENQRAGFVGEYSRAGLTKADIRGPFSNIANQSVIFNDIKLPDRNWFWLTDWTIDKSGDVDSAGWEVMNLSL
jgi:hypothetical protein